MEDSAARDGHVRSGSGTATLRVSRFTQLRVVDAVVTGQHEPGTSHYTLLRAFQDDDVLDRAIGEANARGYRTHEFGDSSFIARAGEPARAPTIRLANNAETMSAATASVGVSRSQPMSSRGMPLRTVRLKADPTSAGAAEAGRHVRKKGRLKAAPTKD